MRRQLYRHNTSEAHKKAVINLQTAPSSSSSITDNNALPFCNSDLPIEALGPDPYLNDEMMVNGDFAMDLEINIPDVLDHVTDETSEYVDDVVMNNNDNEEDGGGVSECDFYVADDQEIDMIDIEDVVSTADEDCLPHCRDKSNIRTIKDWKKVFSRHLRRRSIFKD